MILSQRINNNVNLHSIFKDISVDLIFCLPSILIASQKITLLWSTSLPVYDNMLCDINITPSGSGGGAVAWLVTFCPPIYHCIQAAGLESVVHINVCVSPSIISTTLLSPAGMIVIVLTGTEIKMMSTSIFLYVSIIMELQNIMLVDIYILVLVLANKLSCYLWKVSKIPRVNQKKKIKYTHRLTQVSITSNERINMTSSLPYDRLQIGSWNIVVT